MALKTCFQDGRVLIKPCALLRSALISREETEHGKLPFVSANGLQTTSFVGKQLRTAKPDLVEILPTLFARMCEIRLRHGPLIRPDRAIHAQLYAFSDGRASKISPAVKQDHLANQRDLRPGGELRQIRIFGGLIVLWVARIRTRNPRLREIPECTQVVERGFAPIRQTQKNQEARPGKGVNMRRRGRLGFKAG